MRYLYLIALVPLGGCAALSDPTTWSTLGDALVTVSEITAETANAVKTVDANADGFLSTEEALLGAGGLAALLKTHSFLRDKGKAKDA